MASPRFEPVPDSGPPPLFTGDGAADNAPSDPDDAIHADGSSHGHSTSGAPGAAPGPTADDGGSGGGAGSFPPDPAPEAGLLLAAFATALALAANVPTDVTVFDKVNDHTVAELHQRAGELVRQAGLLFSLTAGQIDRRSAPSLGKEGMARKSGHRTPEAMTTALGGVNRHDAVKAVRDGKLIHSTQTTDNAEKTGADPVDPLTQEPIVVEEPWLIGVGRARTQGMSRECADAIRLGLGTPTEDVTVEMLRTAADYLCTEATRLGPDQLLLTARRLRDKLDAAGIGLRQEERHQKRSLKITRQADGMTRLVLLLDTESAAQVLAIFDNATSPKIGGPRTAPGADADRAQQIVDDPRTPAQLALDTFVHLLTAGADADDSRLLGTGSPSVRILTTAPIPGRTAPAKPHTTVTSTDGHCDCDHDDECNTANTTAEYTSDDFETEFEIVEVACQNGHRHKHTRRRKKRPEVAPGFRVVPAEQLYGPGWIEGQSEPVSADTIARMACTGSVSTITFDDSGQPIDVSSEQRLYARKQRVGLAARDGGCMWTDSTGTSMCERPPSWTEAHHIEQWDRDGGKTTILNGILLCRFHHLTLHNDGWEIHRVGTRYWLIPPTSVEPAQNPRLMRSRSDAYAQLDHLVHGTGPAAPTPERDTGPAPASAGDGAGALDPDGENASVSGIAPDAGPRATDTRAPSTAPMAPDSASPPSSSWADSAPDEATDHVTANGTAYRFVPRRNSAKHFPDDNPSAPTSDKSEP